MTIALLEYILANDMENIKRILENEPERINEMDSNNITIFMYAICNYTKVNEELINYLIAKGADINWRNSAGLTSLHYTMGIKDNSNIINILLYNGADPYVVTNVGHTIEYYAKIWRNYNALEIIIKHKDDMKTLEIFTEISNNSKHMLATIIEILPMCIESYLLHSQPNNPTINLQKEFKKRKLIKMRLH